MELLGTKTLTSSTGGALYWMDFVGPNMTPDPVCVAVLVATAAMSSAETLAVESAGHDASYGDAMTGTANGGSNVVYVQSTPTVLAETPPGHPSAGGADGNGWKVTASTAVDIDVALYLIAGTTRVDSGSGGGG